MAYLAMRGSGSGEWRQCVARWRSVGTCLRAAVSALARGRSADQARHQRYACSDVGLRSTQTCGPRRGQGSLARDQRHARTGYPSRVPTTGLWQLRTGGARVAGGLRTWRLSRQLAGSGAAQRKSVEQREAFIQSGDLNAGFRAPVRNVQAAESAAARSRTTAAPVDAHRNAQCN